jgi:hypothetical protein
MYRIPIYGVFNVFITIYGDVTISFIILLMFEKQCLLPVPKNPQQLMSAVCLPTNFPCLNYPPGTLPPLDPVEGLQKYFIFSPHCITLAG